MASREELAYIAGIVDGEGSIGIYRNKGCKDARYKSGYRVPAFMRSVKIAATHLPLLVHIRDVVDMGRIRQLAQRPGQKTQYEWAIGSKADIICFIALVYEFLIEKQQQASVMLNALNGTMNEVEAMTALKQLKRVDRN